MVYDLDGTLVDTVQDIAAGVQHTLHALGLPPIPMTEIRRAIGRSRLYPDTERVLHYFRDRHQAVITNKPDPFAHQILEALGIAGGSVYPKKPDPASLQALMRQTDAAPEQTLVIGDSPIDAELLMPARQRKW